METAEKLRRTISNDKINCRPRSGAGALFVVPSLGNSPGQIAKDAFFSFLYDFERQLTKLSRSKSHYQEACADDLCALLRELLRNITGAMEISDALAVLASDYWAESAVLSLVERIERDALVARNSQLLGATATPNYHLPLQISRVRILSEWLRKRHATICYLEERAVVEAGAVAIRSVLHDREYLGVKGIEVIASVRLEGFEYQSLWLRLHLYANGEAILVRREWKLWQEDGETFSCSSEQKAQGALGCFTTAAPIIASQQRMLIDGVRLFIPYAALDIVPAQRTEIEIEALLVSEAGITLSTDAVTEFCATPPRHSEARTIPSPFSLGFWPHNLGTGDKIRQLSVQPVSTVVSQREVHSLTVLADIDLYNREGDLLTLEVRFLTPEGYFIESELEGYRTLDGSFCYSWPIRPESVCATYSPLQLSIPLVALELDPGSLRVFAEITVLDRDRNIICGDLVAVELVMPDLSNHSAQLLLTPPERSLDAVMALQAFNIDPEYSFAGRDAVRFEGLLADSATHQEVCQLRLKVCPIGTDWGKCPNGIIRELVFDRGVSRSEQSFVFVIDSEDFMPASLGAATKSQFVATLEVLDGRGLIKLSSKKTFNLPEDFGNECSTWIEGGYAGQGVEIIDAQPRYTPLRGGEVIVDLLVNCDLAVTGQRSYPVYFEPQTQLVNARGQVSDKEEGCVVEMPLLSTMPLGIKPSGERQLRHQIRLPVAFQASRYIALKVMLFSPEGRLLQVLYMPLRPHRRGARQGSLTAERTAADTDSN